MRYKKLLVKMEEEKKHNDQTQSEEEILDNTDAAESDVEEKS